MHLLILLLVIALTSASDPLCDPVKGPEDDDCLTASCPRAPSGCSHAPPRYNLTTSADGDKKECCQNNQCEILNETTCADPVCKKYSGPLTSGCPTTTTCPELPNGCKYATFTYEWRSVGDKKECCQGNPCAVLNPKWCADPPVCDPVTGPTTWVGCIPHHDNCGLPPVGCSFVNDTYSLTRGYPIGDIQTQICCRRRHSCSLVNPETCGTYNGNCANGELIRARERTQDNHCGSCNDGFYLGGKSCRSDWRTIGEGLCQNGIDGPSGSTAIKVTNVYRLSHCQRLCGKNCSAVSFKYGTGTCFKWQSKFGPYVETTPRTGYTCSSKSDGCRPGHYWVLLRGEPYCYAYKGDCANGNMIEQSQRTQENHCGSCNDGFYLGGKSCRSDWRTIGEGLCQDGKFGPRGSTAIKESNVNTLSDCQSRCGKNCSAVSFKDGTCFKWQSKFGPYVDTKYRAGYTCSSKSDGCEPGYYWELDPVGEPYCYESEVSEGPQQVAQAAKVAQGQTEEATSSNGNRDSYNIAYIVLMTIIIVLLLVGIYYARAILIHKTTKRSHRSTKPYRQLKHGDPKSNTELDEVSIHHKSHDNDVAA